jgi:nucleotide-binding universal stress UspA family protein
MMNTRGLTELIVLNIGLSLHVISPVLFTMLVIMALTTTFMTSPLLQWTYPKQLIRQSEPDYSLAEPQYRILIPVANPASQRGLLQIALAIAGLDHSHSPLAATAAIYPLNLIEQEENYAYKGTPREASRQIAQRRIGLETFLKDITPENSQPFVRSIVQITSDVARETAKIVEVEAINLVILGWHRPMFSNNRLGGRVGKILSQAHADVAVYVQTHHSSQAPDASFQNILVPYTSNDHNDLALELALRLLISHEQAQLTLLRLAPEQTELPEFSYEMRTKLAQLGQSVSDRISQAVILPNQPIQAVIEASKRADLTIAGASREWGLERQTLGHYADALSTQCFSSLLITRRYNRNTSHLEPLLEKASGSTDQPLPLA